MISSLGTDRRQTRSGLVRIRALTTERQPSHRIQASGNRCPGSPGSAIHRLIVDWYCSTPCCPWGGPSWECFQLVRTLAIACERTTCERSALHRLHSQERGEREE